MRKFFLGVIVGVSLSATTVYLLGRNAPKMNLGKDEVS